MTNLFSLRTTTINIIGAVCLLASTPAALAKAVLTANLPGVATEGMELLVALPIQNTDDTGAFRITVTEIELREGHRDTPMLLPVQLGTIAPDGFSVLNLRFDVRSLGSQRSFNDAITPWPQ
jgi:hypothetical protein